jgi:predicted chitinase
MAKLTSKFVRVSTSIDAKVLEDGKIKRAGATVVGKSYSTVIKSLNGLGAAFTSQASAISSYSESLKNTVSITETLSESIKKLSEARSETAKNLTTPKKPKASETKDTKKSPMEKAMQKDVKDKSSPFFKGIGKLLGFFKGFIGKLFVFAVAQSVLKWISDPKNAKKVTNIFNGLKSVFGFLFNVVKGVTGLVVGGIVNLGSGLQKIFGSGGDPKKILSGFGDLLQALPGLFTIAWILNPVGMFKSIIRILTSWKEPRQKEPDPPEKPKKPEAPKKPKTPPKKPGFFDKVTDKLKKGGESITKGVQGISDTLGKQGTRFMDAANRRLGGIADFLGENWKKLSNAYKNTVTKLQEFGSSLVKKGQTAVLDWLSKQGGILGKVGKSLPELLQKFGKYLPFVGDVLGFVMDIASGVDWRRALIRAVVGAGVDAGFTALMGALGLATPFTGGASGIAATALFVAYMGADLAVGGIGKVIGDPIADALGIPMKAGEDSEKATIGSVPSEDQALKQSQEAISKKDPNWQQKIAEKEGKSAEDGGILTPDGKTPPLTGGITTKNQDYWMDLLGTGGVTFGKGGPTTVRSLLSQALYWQYLFADATLKLKKKGIFQRGIEGIANAVASTGEKLSAGLQRVSTFGGNVLAKLGIGTGEYGEAPLKKAAEAAGIKGKELAAFLAQMSHESGGFNYKEEISGGKDSYDGGKRYKGRGYIQLTHRYNYAKYGKEFGVDLVKNPDLAKDGELAAKIAVSYWMRSVRPTVNGDWDNVFLHSKAINYPAATRKSQVNGMEDREKRYAAYLKKLGLDKKSSGGKIKSWSEKAQKMMPQPSFNAPEPAPFHVPGWDEFSAGGQYKNGHVPKSELRKVTGYGGSVGYGYLHNSVSTQFQSMIEAAKKDGHGLGINSTYRSYQDQVSMKARKGYLAATPGTSNHGWGKAADLWYSDAGYKWLWKNAGKFGFKPLSGWGLSPNTPDKDEAWHWENLGGGGKKSTDVKTEPATDDGSNPSSNTGTDPGARPKDNQDIEQTPEQSFQSALNALISASQDARSAFGAMTPSSPTIPATGPERSAGGSFKPIVNTMESFGSAMEAIVFNAAMVESSPPENMPVMVSDLHTNIAEASNLYAQLQLNVKTELIMNDSHIVTQQPQQVKTMILNNTVRTSQQIVTGTSAYPVYSGQKSTRFFN